MQNELHEGALLDKRGNLEEKGFAYSLKRKYNRNDIKANKLRIKEWDYYYISDENWGIALTIDDNSYMGLVSLSILDFINGREVVTKSPMFFFPKGKTNFPPTSEKGDVIKKGKGYTFAFYNDGIERHLVCSMDKVNDDKSFHCDILLSQINPNSMVIATPFFKERHFYYNQKINLLEAKGYFEFGDFRYDFEKDAFGTLDWGRGVWTYKNTWYWSSANGISNNMKVGWNLGYGFGDNSRATENMVFVNEKAYKLNDVCFLIPKNGKKDDFLSKWEIRSNDRCINLVFTPIFDRKSNTNAILIQSDQHQVFGRFNGYFKIEGNKIIEINNILGFAEKVMNRW